MKGLEILTFIRNLQACSAAEKTAVINFNSALNSRKARIASSSNKKTVIKQKNKVKCMNYLKKYRKDAGLTTNTENMHRFGGADGSITPSKETLDYLAGAIKQ